MENENLVPDYLHDTYQLLKCAFPQGISQADYWPTMAILHEVMSFWTIADVLSVLAHKDRFEVYNDASGFGLDPLPSEEDITRVKSKLESCGYEEWLKKE